MQTTRLGLKDLKGYVGTHWVYMGLHRACVELDGASYIGLCGRDIYGVFQDV